MRRLASGSVPAAALTLLLVAYGPVDSKSTGAAISTTLGFALIMTAVTLIFRKRLFGSSPLSPTKRDRQRGRAADDNARRGARRAGFDLVGRRGRDRRHRAADALSEDADRPHRRLRHRPCRAADAVAGAGHWWIGSVDWYLLVRCWSARFPGIMIGSHFAYRVPDKVLRPLLAGTLALVGGRLVF